MTIKTLGIDIGKSTFHLFGLDERGRPELKQKLTREKLMRFIANLPACVIGMESCPGSQHLARRFLASGHDVRLMAAQFVKPYVKSNKSDFLDAEAIAEAVTRPTMRFVPVKTLAQGDLQALHRVREGLIGSRTVIVNQIRAFLLERGIAVAQGISRIRAALPGFLEDAENDLTTRMRALLFELCQGLRDLDERIKRLSVEIEREAHNDPACQRLMTIPGVGPMSATALFAAIGDVRTFHSGRELAAFLGLVPRQHSTGGKPKLLGISKRGNTYVRTLLIHGARAVLRHSERRTDRLGRWVCELRDRAHANVVACALANKNARIAWAVLTKGVTYQASALAGEVAAAA
ncbi:MAG: IS110 family transposase [Gammaproteobacteria bacterium]|nr:IS110 family transposase [Gammaproteobacteria bacterium]